MYEKRNNEPRPTAQFGQNQKPNFLMERNYNPVNSVK
jgi:hypothetical protein